MNERKNCQWLVARRPQGNVTDADFEYRETAIPQPGDGEFLLRTLYLNLAPVMRMYMTGGSFAGESPLDIGDVIHGRGVAEVVESNHADFSVGDIVQGQLGWQTYKASKGTAQEKFRKIPDYGVSYAIGLSTFGMTGFFCLLRLRRLRQTAAERCRRRLGCGGRRRITRRANCENPVP